MPEGTVRILAVEDDAGDVAILRVLLPDIEGMSFVFERADSLAAAIGRLGRGHVDIVLLDLGLPDSQGLHTLDRVRAAAPHVPIVVLAGLDDTETGQQAVQRGAQDYLVKGRVDASLLVHSIGHAIERHRMMNELLESVRANDARLTPLSVYVDPGDAPPELITELYLALDCAYRSLGGTGLRIVDEQERVLVPEVL